MDITMTQEDDGPWVCSAGCPFVFETEDVAYHLEWHHLEWHRQQAQQAQQGGSDE